MGIFSPTAILAWSGSTATKSNLTTYPVTYRGLRRLLATALIVGFAFSISLTPVAVQAAGREQTLNPQPAILAAATSAPTLLDRLSATVGYSVEQANHANEGYMAVQDNSGEEPTSPDPTSPDNEPCPIGDGKGGSTPNGKTGVATKLRNHLKVLGLRGFDIEGSGTRGCGG